MHIRKYPAGFTLVELAIVITIIGLLIGGVLKGQELLENARMTSTATQVKSYETALTTFRDLYKGFPGDLSQATNIIEGCTAGNSCSNGNGDAVVESTIGYYWQGYPTTLAGERTQFWKQMALAGLITGVSGNASTLGSGISHPASKLGGSIFVPMTLVGSTYTISGSTYSHPTGTGLALTHSVDTTGWNCYGDFSVCTATPKQAWAIDIKMDDGVALTGVVHSISKDWTSGCGSPQIAPNGYMPSLAGPHCDMLFMLGS